jgi:HK97 family phage portal protein
MTEASALILPRSYGERKGASPVTESAATAMARQVPSTKGYLADVPLGGTTPFNPGSTGGATRQEFADQLYGAYMSCTWASACVDVIARTVTAGGLELTPDDEDIAEDEQPPEVKALQDLIDFVNPRENMRQLLRGVVTDLLVYGDAFVEIVYLGKLPVALYSLDSPSMVPLADEHGNVSGYTQQLDPFRTANFEPHEVLHFTLDSPRGGVYGVGAIQKALLPITAWLFTAGLLKETMRKGDPPRVHLDYPDSVPRDNIEVDRQKWLVKNIGVANVGNPFMTRGGAKAADLKVNQVAEYVGTLNQKRDEIIGSMGVPPRKLSIAEPGQLGGTGEGTAADKTFRVNTCGPLAELVLEVFNYGLAFLAFGVTNWSLKFGEVDWRDDEVIENIRDQRLRNGSWTLNRYRREIDEDEVEGGDDPVLVDRQNLVLWSDLAALSKATVTKAASPPCAGRPGHPRTRKQR